MNIDDRAITGTTHIPALMQDTNLIQTKRAVVLLTFCCLIFSSEDA